MHPRKTREVTDLWAEMDKAKLEENPMDSVEWPPSDTIAATRADVQSRMWNYLNDLADAGTIRGTETFDSRMAGNVSNIHRKLLAAFGQCTDIPIFSFDLRLHRRHHWLILYVSAVRCSIGECGRGFVFLSWDNKGWDDGHSTLLYFDIRERKQMLFDPSLAIEDELLDFMATHHLWESNVESNLKLTVTDHPKDPDKEPLQEYFETDVG